MGRLSVATFGTFQGTPSACCKLFFCAFLSILKHSRFHPRGVVPHHGLSFTHAHTAPPDLHGHAHFGAGCLAANYLAFSFSDIKLWWVSGNKHGEAV